MMIEHKKITEVQLRSLIRENQVVYGGNRKLKIYGLLSCKSGKRMNVENRVFFATIDEAIEKGYRPCGHCMREAYKLWKDGVI